MTESKRDGDRHIFQLKVGKADMELKPSYSAAGIEEVVVDDDEVKVVHAGLAGAGVGAAMCRGMAKGVKRVERTDIGGGSKVGRAAVVTPKLQKVIVGIDDTDTKEEGATWTLANNIGIELSKRGFEYLDHVTCQLYPHNPNKTQNCVAIALVFAVKPEMKEEMINKICEILKRDTLSDKTAIAVMDGFDVPDVLREYGEATKKSMMTVEDAENVAKKAGVELIQVTGAPGEIGCTRSIGSLQRS